MALRDRINRTAPALPDWAKDVTPADAHAQHSPVSMREYEMIPRDKIKPWPANHGAGARTRDVHKLQDDILGKRASGGGIQGTGITEALTVRPDDDGKYILVKGERRYRATDGTAVTELPCIILKINEGEALEESLREVIHTQEWTPLQEGHAFLDYMSGKNKYNEPRSIRQTCKDFGGLSEGYILNRTRAAQASADLQELIEKRPDALSHLEYLVKVENPRRRKELIRAVQSGASVRSIAQQVAELNKTLPAPSHRAPEQRAPLSIVPSLPPRPAYEGITKAGEYTPPQSTLTSRTVVIDETPASTHDAAHIATQAATLWQQLLETNATYSDVSNAVRSTLSVFAELKKRETKAA